MSVLCCDFFIIHDKNLSKLLLVISTCLAKTSKHIEVLGGIQFVLQPYSSHFNHIVRLIAEPTSQIKKLTVRLSTVSNVM